MRKVYVKQGLDPRLFKVPKVKGDRMMDFKLDWVHELYPQLDPIREMALEWLHTLPKISRSQLQALSLFFEKYLIYQQIPPDFDMICSKSTMLPNYYQTVCTDSRAGATNNNQIHEFFNYVLITRFGLRNERGVLETNDKMHNPIQYRHSKNLLPNTRKVRGVSGKCDLSFMWIQKEYSGFDAWRAHCETWMKGQTRGVSTRLKALAVFIEKYLVQYSLPKKPEEFLSRRSILPNFYETACVKTRRGIQYNNLIHNFIEFVLHDAFSVDDDYGRPVVSNEFHNPVPLRSNAEMPKLEESVHSPLPYGFLDRLQQIIASGAHFRDWKWAQGVMGVSEGKSGSVATDWFHVTKDQIDPNDPDCVFRVRKRTRVGGGDVLEMWSPVRWVALLVKVLVPLRTFQVRMLDSGEADTWRFEAGRWVLNPSRLAKGTEARPYQQGVFRRLPKGPGQVEAQLYINTNKTADMKKSGPEKGFSVPWPEIPDPLHRNVYYWLEKLRNWQEKYNPVSRQTRWTELDLRHIETKSDIQMASYADTCFLFRARETRLEDRHLPIPGVCLNRPWYALLSALQSELKEKGETHADGTAIQLVMPWENSNRGSTTYFPLHSMRVSMVTALALDGRVPFPILQKAVGHSRLLMTLYYTKIGEAHFAQALKEGVERLEAAKGESILNFLRNTEHARLVEKAICNSPASLAVAIPVDPADRNPAGWLDMGHGWCLVGGNISENEENKRVGGCFNGGPQVSFEARGRFAPVPGGMRNCIRCRWFVTMPHYLPALAAKFNNLSYRVDEAMAEATRAEMSFYKIKEEQAEVTQAGGLFDRMNSLRQTERVRESALGRWNDLAENLVACWRLIERCMDALNKRCGDCQASKGTQLISVGTGQEVKATFEETNSELLQLSGICEDLELYPDLEPGKAVLRRSQLLDAAFANEGQPPLFLRFSEQDQLLIGNEVMRRLSRTLNPALPEIGRRQVIAMIDAGENIGQRLGLDLAALVGEQAGWSDLHHSDAHGRKHALYDRHSS